MVGSELAEMGWWDSNPWKILRVFSKRLTCRERLGNCPGRATRKV